MNKNVAYAETAGTSHSTELINRTVLASIADAWNRYPSDVSLPKLDVGDQELLGQVLGFLARDGVIWAAGNSMGLTRSGYEVVQQAWRVEDRIADLLRYGTLPAEPFGNLSIMLAIVRAHFESFSASGR